MAQKNALSRHQFAASGFDPTSYAFHEEPGLFAATVDCKRWGKHKLVTYFTLADGRKVVAPTWPNCNYLGLAELSVCSKVELDFQHTRTGKINLKNVTALDDQILSSVKL